jgi:GAF domain-containing protein
MGARALPAAVLGPPQPGEPRQPASGAAGLRAQLERARLEGETLAAVIALVTSSPDLERVLGGVVDLLTRATGCHACFVYLRSGERLRLRAASHVYAHLVGNVEFDASQGLAGWVAQRNTPAFIRENALEDPRNHYVPELEEERFQSMAAVPVRSREGPAIGVIVLHTVAPHEFGDQTMGLLAHTAPLLAGTIENAQLYQGARRRVQALTELAAIAQQIASVAGREEVLRAATDGVRTLLGCEVAHAYELDGASGRLELVASSPPGEPPRHPSSQTTALLRELLRRRSPGTGAGRVAGAELGFGEEDWELRAVPVAAGGEQLGVLVAAGRKPMEEDAPEELLALIASQLAIALEKAELIERLTEENIVRELFLALERGEPELATIRARDARIDLDRPYAILELRPAAATGDPATDAPSLFERAEPALRRLAPGAVCDAGPELLRALLPLASGSARELRALDDGLATLAREGKAAIGRSEAGRGARRGGDALREAADAAAVAHALEPMGATRSYGELGAYRYLVHVTRGETPHDPYLTAVRAIARYDERRGTQLIATLEAYLADRRSVSRAARVLRIHPNTLRQRLERIAQLSGIELADADLLALELAIKLARLHPEDEP